MIWRRRMKKAKHDKDWAWAKPNLFEGKYYDRDIRSSEDIYQDAAVEAIEKRLGIKMPKKKTNHNFS